MSKTCPYLGKHGTCHTSIEVILVSQRYFESTSFLPTADQNPEIEPCYSFFFFFWLSLMQPFPNFLNNFRVISSLWESPVRCIRCHNMPKQVNDNLLTIPSPFLEFFPGGQRKTRVCNKGLEDTTAAWIIHDLQNAWTLCLYLIVGYILRSYHGRQIRGDSCTVCRQLKILWAQIRQQCLHSLEKPAGEGPWPLQAVITGISGIAI